MNLTPKVKCTCENTYQDTLYGKQMRVTTPNNTEQSKKSLVVRCTVCGKEHRLGDLK